MWDDQRIALVTAESDTDHREDVATGYFLTADLVLTVWHVGKELSGTVSFSVRAEVGESEKERWSDATIEWSDVGLDAMLLRTKKTFGKWQLPTYLPTATIGHWVSSGYAKARAGIGAKNRKPLPVDGTFRVSKGQGFAELSLTIQQEPTDVTLWRGLSGSPVFVEGETGGLVGIVTDAMSGLKNVVVGLPIARLLDDLQFLTALKPSFLGALPSGRWCLVLTGEGTSVNLAGKVVGALHRCRSPDPKFVEQKPVEVSVLDALASPENWAVTVEALARATFVIADVTSYEPAVMVLLGVRSVLRRGVTVSVTTDPPGTQFSSTPFNVQETKVLSFHDGQFLGHLSRVMMEGDTYLRADGNYLDLPCYHAVRAPLPANWAEDDGKRVLVLCPFKDAYAAFYDNELTGIISTWASKEKAEPGAAEDVRESDPREPVRMLDLRSPRLVGQSLYEQIRWSTYCLVDWTAWRPNVSFELGVRLACSEHQPLIVAQEPVDPQLQVECGRPRPLVQQQLLHALFGVLRYDPADPYGGHLTEAIEQWDASPGSTSPAGGGRLPAGSTFAIAQKTFDWAQERLLDRPDEELKRDAERARSEDPYRNVERLVLFSANTDFDVMLTAAVREKWIAAWLYLRHRAEADDCPEEIHDAFRTLGRHLELALSGSTDGRHERLRRDLRRSSRATRAPRAPEAGDVDV